MLFADLFVQYNQTQVIKPTWLCAVCSRSPGHGINDLFHCPPNVPHYAKVCMSSHFSLYQNTQPLILQSKATGSMKAGMVCDLQSRNYR